MKYPAIALCSLFLLFGGCHAASTTTPPAPGYLNAADQQLGESLAAVNGFVNQEKLNYAQEDAATQAKEKPLLNDLITATNLANAAYTAYHAGTGTIQQAQAALTQAQTAQNALATLQGVK